MEFLITELDSLIKLNWWATDNSNNYFFHYFLQEVADSKTNFYFFNTLMVFGMIKKDEIFGIKRPVLSELKATLGRRGTSVGVQEIRRRLEKLVNCLQGADKQEGPPTKKQKGNLTDFFVTVTKAEPITKEFIDNQRQSMDAILGIKRKN